MVFYGLFEDTDSNGLCSVDDKMIHDWWIGKDLEGRSLNREFMLRGLRKITIVSATVVGGPAKFEQLVVQF
jgi:hypothetical protein